MAASVMTNDGSDAIQRKTSTPKTLQLLSRQEVIEYFNVSETSEEILNCGYSKIALQFPDDLLPYSSIVASELKGRTQKEIFILADTSYGSCCVDEVAAEHVNSDFIVHYGHACLSPTSRLPVFYVFERKSIDVDKTTQMCRTVLSSNPGQNLYVLYDVGYTYIYNELMSQLSNQNILERIRISKLATRYSPDNRNDLVFSRYQQEPHESDIILYIGPDGATFTDIAYNFPKLKILRYDPDSEELISNIISNKALMKRYYLIQKVKDADVVGIVVGTLGIASYLKMIDDLKHLIHQAGKKSYVFVMGKLNVAKLANFMEIDIFVLVACPENSLIDSKEFYRPIVTPFELKMGTVKGMQWTGDYVTDFRKLLLNDSEKVAVGKNDSEDDEPHFSLITGGFKHNRKFHNKSEDPVIESSQDLSIRDKKQEIAIGLGSAAGQFLNSRTFYGLEPKLGETPVELAKSGLQGIAKGYKDEPN